MTIPENSSLASKVYDVNNEYFAIKNLDLVYKLPKTFFHTLALSFCDVRFTIQPV